MGKVLNQRNILNIIFIIIIFILGYLSFVPIKRLQSELRSRKAKSAKIESMEKGVDFSIFEEDINTEGESVIFYFWSPFCNYCKETTELLIEKEQAFTDAGISLYSVTSFQDREYLEYYLDRNDTPGEVIVDGNADISRYFQVTSTPELWIISEGSADYAVGLPKIKDLIMKYE